MPPTIHRLLLVTESPLMVLPLSGAARAGFCADVCHPRSAELRLRTGRYAAVVVIVSAANGDLKEKLALWKAAARGRNFSW